MFIPRTLASTESTGRGAWARATIVGGFLALALFAVMSVSIGTGQVNLAAGDVACSREFDAWLRAHGSRLAWSD